MARRARSARGEVVDFDLLEIKQQLAGMKTDIAVSTRQEYVDKKSTKAKPQPGVVPEHIQDADWNVLNAGVESDGS